MRCIEIEDGDIVGRVPLVPVLWAMLVLGGFYAVYGPSGSLIMDFSRGLVALSAALGVAILASRSERDQA